jgi:hypothetical protein
LVTLDENAALGPATRDSGHAQRISVLPVLHCTPRSQLQFLAGDGRRARCGEFIEAAAHMRPAEGQFDVTALGHHAIAGIPVGL